MKKDIKIEVREVLKNNNNTAQKKYLASKKQLRVWIEDDKFERFKAMTASHGTSMHRLINDYIDMYLVQCDKENTDKKAK